MLRSLKYSIRLVKKPFRLQQYRLLSAQATQPQNLSGEHGHYDIIIVGGGAAGISLAGALG